LQKHKDTPFAPEVQYRVAEHYMNRKNFAQAEKEFTELKNRFPGSNMEIQATYWRGQSRFEQLKLHEAIADWNELLARNSYHNLAPKSKFRSGLAYYRLQEYPQALEVFKQVVDTYGNTPSVAADAQFNIGMTFRRMNRTEEAVEAYLLTVEKYPASPLAARAQIRVGYIYEDEGKYDQAISAYQKVVAADKGRLGAEAQFLIGDCYMAQKKTGQAYQAYQEVVKNFLKEGNWSVTALAKMGELMEAQGKNKEAIAHYQQIVKMGQDPGWISSAKRRIEMVEQRIRQQTPVVVKESQNSESGDKVNP
jgi:TolA-binding protein